MPSGQKINVKLSRIILLSCTDLKGFITERLKELEAGVAQQVLFCKENMDKIELRE